MGYTEYQQVIRDQSEGFTSKIIKKREISSLIVYITNNHILGSEVFVTVYLEEVETSWLLISLHDEENFTIKRTGVCDWTTAKTSSQNSRKTVVLQLESSWVVEKLMFFRSLYENEISCCFNSIWECCIKLQQALKKVKYLECFFLLTLKSAILLDANHSARKEKGNIWSTSFGFEVKKNCSSKLLLN